MTRITFMQISFIRLLCIETLESLIERVSSYLSRFIFAGEKSSDFHSAGGTLCETTIFEQLRQKIGSLQLQRGACWEIPLCLLCPAVKYRIGFARSLFLVVGSFYSELVHLYCGDTTLGAVKIS